MIEMRSLRSVQRGIFLLEALIGILLFSFGVLGLIALQVNAITAQSDAQYRIEAANFVDRILGQINASVGRDANGLVIVANLNDFAYNTGTSSACSFSGGGSGNPFVTAWATAIRGVEGLPGSSASMQQILIDTANANQAMVSVCWKSPKDPAPRIHRVIAYIN